MEFFRRRELAIGTKKKGNLSETLILQSIDLERLVALQQSHNYQAKQIYHIQTKSNAL